MKLWLWWKVLMVVVVDVAGRDFFGEARKWRREFLVY